MVEQHERRHTMKPAAVDEAGRLLWSAWCTHARLVSLPNELLPATVEQGYAVQDALIRCAGLEVTGWKIGATNVTAQRFLNLTGPLSGRLFAPFCASSPARFDTQEFAIRGLEPEFAFRISRDLPAKAQPYTRAELCQAIEAAHPALEVPDTRFESWDTLGAPTFIADNAAAGRLVLGPPDRDWTRRDLAAMEVRLLINGDVFDVGCGGNALGHPLDALAWLVNHLPTRGQHVRAGEVVTTGTCTAIGFADPGDEVVADFGAFGSARATFL